MYAENSTEIDEEFFDALVLLRSNDDDSTEKLRKMLDEQIEKRYGKSKTLAVRMPKECLQKEITRCKTYSKSSLKFTPEKNPEINEPDNHCNEINEKSVKKIKINVQRTYDEGNDDDDDDDEDNYDDDNDDDDNDNDEFEKIDIPRISIPDDIATDGALCKICNGTKLGPLILLECQECQEIYHPLCHNPAVIDIDVYDPRLVWRCGKCVEVRASSYETPLPPPPPPPTPLLEEDRKDDVKKILNKCSKIVNVEKKKPCVKMYGNEKMFKRRR
ncbi:integrator complex subunit 12-like [Polistes fuscatus]|uniref:integrator complex subunit 12-like n=1 Tax=Polistes fuscatus TaxID=30207 RepID=UPI001CA95C14|nr:integrator complex subunit 12-like [Polistes fuscatus]